MLVTTSIWEGPEVVKEWFGLKLRIETIGFADLFDDVLK